MRVLVVSDVSPVAVTGGAERVLWEHVSRLAARGHRVRVVARSPNDRVGEETVHAGIGVRHFPAPRASLATFVRMAIEEARAAVTAEIDSHGADVLHCHQPLSAFAALRSAVGRRIPSLYTFHSPAPLEYRLRRGTTALHQGGLLGGAGVALLWGLERAALARATRIHVLSEFSADLLWRLYRIGGERLVKVPGGVDLRRFHPAPDRAAVRAALGLPAERPVLLTVRNLEPRMGLDILIHALDRLRLEAPGVLLLIGGAGALRDALETLVTSLGLREHVRFLGFVPEADLPRYYQAADAFVLPTRALEGFGLVTVEALACGTPVLGTRVGATPEILGPLDPGLLFAASTAEAMAADLARFLAGLARAPVAEGDARARYRRYAEARYGWERVVGELAEVLEALAVRAEPPRALTPVCAACDSPALRPAFRHRGAVYRVCARCGSAVTPVMPSDADRRRVYETEYPARFSPEHAPPARLELFRRIVARLGPGRGRLLDVGCGGGRLLAVAGERGWRLAGTDLSHVACVAARKAAGALVVQAEGHALPVRDGSIAAVTLVNVLDHAPGPALILAEAHRVLGPGGTLVIRVPNGAFHRATARALAASGPFGRWSGLDRLPILHLHAFTAAGLRRLVERTGFTVLDVRNSSLVAEVPFASLATGLRILVGGLAVAASILTGGRWLVGPSIELFARRGAEPGERPA